MKQLFFNLLFALAFLAPNTPVGDVLVMAIPIVMWIFFAKKQLHSDVRMFACLGLIIGTIINVIAYGYLFNNSVVRALNMAYLFALFPFFTGTKYTVSPKTLWTIGIIILLSQFGQMLRITAINNIINSIYPSEEVWWRTPNAIKELSMNFSSRYGGLYRNPNDCGRNINILAAIYFMIHYRKENMVVWMFSLLMMYSSFLTGSRTNLIISVCLFLVMLYNIRSLTRFQKQLLLASAAIGLFITFTFFVGENTRIKQTSFTAEERQDMWTTLLYYYMKNFHEFPFGKLYKDTLGSNGLGFSGGFDSDLGSYLYYYGLVNLVLLLLFLKLIWRHCGRLCLYVAPILLTMLSNGLFTSLHACCMFMITLTTLWQRANQIASTTTKITFI